MPKALALLFLFILHLKPISNTAAWIEYGWNIEYIQEVLCINKEKPELKCGGKCYLMQQLYPELPDETQNYPKVEITKIEYVDLRRLHNFDLTELNPDYRLDNYPVHSLKYPSINHGVFHPPRV